MQSDDDQPPDIDALIARRDAANAALDASIVIMNAEQPVHPYSQAVQPRSTSTDMRGRSTRRLWPQPRSCGRLLNRCSSSDCTQSPQRGADRGTRANKNDGKACH